MLALLGEMSQRNEFGVFFGNEQRKEILRGVVLGYYKDTHAKKLVFDTNRFWCSRMSLVAGLYPNARVIAMVRHLPIIVHKTSRFHLTWWVVSSAVKAPRSPRYGA